MRSEALPIIRIQLDHMKHSIASMLGVEGSDFEKALNSEIDKQVTILAEDEIPRIVRESLLQCAKDSINAYFSYGEGRKVIDETIKKSFFVGKSEAPDAKA